MVEFIRGIWPSLAAFLGNKFKAKFRARDIVIDGAVDDMVAQLSKHPLPMPVTAIWVNTVVEILWPVIRAFVNKMIHKRVLPRIMEKLPGFLQSMDINPCSLGTKAPRIVPPIKAADHTIDGGGVALEFDVEYEGDADIQIAYKGSTIGVKEITFKATFFIDIGGMLPKAPFFRGLSMYMCKPCDFGLKWVGLLEMLDLRLVEDIIRKTLNDILAGMFLLPNRFGYVHDPTNCNVFDIKRPKPIGCLQLTLLQAEGLVGIESDVRTLFTGELNTDPFVTIAVGSESWKSTTVWHSTNPQWDEDNVHLFQVDTPARQHVRIHVWDDGFIQSLKAKAVGSGAESESEEVARSTKLTVMDLLGKMTGDPLAEEIILERWVDLDSWWPSRDKIILEQQELAKQELVKQRQQGTVPEEDESKSDKGKGIFTSTVDWARQKWSQRKSRLESEYKNTLMQAKARVKLHVHWRPLTYGTPLPYPPPPPAHTLPQQVVPRQLPNASPFGSVLVQQPAPMAISQPLAVQTWPYQGGPLQTRSAVYPPVVTYRTQLAPIPQGGRRRSKKSTVKSSESGSESDGGSSSSCSSSSSSSSSSDAWCGWPPYALRVGVTIVEKLLCADEDLTTRFFVTCNALPVVNGDCREVKEKTKNVTTKTTKKRYPLTEQKAAHVQRVSNLMHREDCLIRKMGMLAQLGLSVDTIADVLDVDHAMVLRLREEALVEMTGRRDVIFDEAFVYYLNDPSVAEVRLEVWCEVPKKEPKSIGFVNLKVGALLYREDMAEELMRLPLMIVDEEALAALQAAPGAAVEDIKNPPLTKDRFTKISAQCQMWPIVSKCLPHAPRLGQGACAVKETKEDPSQKMVTAVFVYSASDLRNVDMWGGKSDPYCICTLVNGTKSKKLFQTKVIDNDPDPVWRHGPEDVKWGTEKAIHFAVYDKDFCRKGDMLGEVSVTREQARHGLFTDLSLGDGNGTLRVKIAPLVEQTMTDVPYTKPTPLPRVGISVLRAEDLHGSLNAGIYVVGRISEQQTFRTPASQTNPPLWDHGPEVFSWGDHPDLHFEVRQGGLRGHSLGVATLKKEVCLKGFIGAVTLGSGHGLLHVKIDTLPPLDEPCIVRLEVSVLSAQDLRNADMFGGKSDPYVVCKLKGKEQFRTKVIWDNESPTWNHGPEQVVLRQQHEVLFEVFDKDMVGQGDLLGRAAVGRHACVTGFDGHLDLGQGNGSLHVRIHPDASQSADDWTAQEAKAEPSPEPGEPGEEPARLPPVDFQHVGAWVDVARGMTARMMSVLMKHLPCGK